MKALVSLLVVLLLTGSITAPEQTLAPVLRARDWMNGRLVHASVAGKVVVVDVFSVDCDSCQEVVSALRGLYADKRRQGLAIVGVHTPESPQEQQRPYVAAKLKTLGVTWPVAVDNAWVLWDAYGVNAWPTQLFFDRHGHLRKVLVGGSQDAEVRNEVEALLAEH